MKEICLNNLGTFPEEFVLAKVDVENLLIEDKFIENKMSLEEFIQYLQLQNTVYLNGTQTIAFRYIKGKTSDYIFYTFSDEKTQEEAITRLKDKLSEIKYDFTKLKKLNMSDFSDFDFSNYDMFLIGQSFYK